MQNFSIDQIFGLAVWLTFESAVREYYRQNPVASDMISTNELIHTHTELVVDIYMMYLGGEPHDKIEELYNEKMAFIRTLTKKF